MFDKENVEKVMNVLKQSPKYFVSESHFQMSFTLAAYKLFGESFHYYPEYPLKRNNKSDLIDLVIIDKKTNEKTFIEFKHKTKNITGNVANVCKLKLKTVDEIEFEPTNMGACDLGRFDCWSDIERLEYYKDNSIAKNCFFIFVTNDFLYLEKDGTKTYGDAFSMVPGSHIIKNKCWATWDGESVSSRLLGGIGKKRNRLISTKSYDGDYEFKYEVFIDESNIHKYCKYWSLVVDIK